MAGQEYQAIHDQIRIVELAVLEVIDENPIETLNEQNDLTEYKEWIKAVNDPYNQFKNLIHQVIVRPPQGVDGDKIDQLNE